MRVGSLCSGMGGLEMGVHAVYGGTTAWVSDIDKGACKILAHRFPDVPNLGDMTTVDWSTVEPVDLICGGTPCQDLSHAGRRAGMSQGTRSNLWVAMREAVATIRPRLVIWENVGGAYSARADSEMERDPRLLGVRPDGPVLRALGRVLGDLASLGYDASWHGLRAADVGAPHGRFRVFVVATDATSDAGWKQHGDDGTPRDANVTGLEGRLVGGGRTGERAPRATGRQPTLLPSPRTSDTNGAGRHGDGGLDLRTAVGLLPTPAVNDMGEGKTVEAWDEWTDAMKAKHGNGNGHGASLSIEAQRLLPTPRSQNGEARNQNIWERPAGEPQNLENALAHVIHQWGDYAAAIARWETVLGRAAPDPTVTNAKGNPQLSPVFVEWLMGLPEGWVTDVPGITRNEALRAIGNGVVPQQAEAALRVMASWEAAA